MENRAGGDGPTPALIVWLASNSRACLNVSWVFYVVVATAVTFVINTPLDGDPRYFVDIARSVAAGDGFIERHLFAYRPPGFPAWLGLAISLGLDELSSLKLLMVATMSATVPVCWVLCRDTFGRAAGALGAVFAACNPWFVRLPDLMYSEGLFIPLFALLLWLLHRCLTEPSLGRFALAGFACGITALVREVVFYVPLLLSFTLLVSRFQAGWRRRVAFIALFTMCEAAAITPWTLRNHTIFSKPIAISTNPWINIYIGNNPTHVNVHDFRWSIPKGLFWNARPQPNGQDELEVAETCKREAVRYITAEPLAFVRRAAAKMWMFVTPHFDLVGKQSSALLAVCVLADLLLYCLLLSGALWHIARNYQNLRNGPYIVFCLTYAAYSVCVAGITYSNSRYRLPFMVVTLLLATPGILDLVGLFRFSSRLVNDAPGRQRQEAEEDCPPEGY